MTPLKLDAKRSALVLIDLQNGIVALPLAPHDGQAVLDRSTALADRFRAAGALVIVVAAVITGDPAALLNPPVDADLSLRHGDLAPDYAELSPGVLHDGDVLVIKRQWGAFYGTDLDLQLRRRGIDTLVFAGIATNFGVESSARAAWEHGYAVVIAEDAVTSFTKELHDMTMTAIFPRIARVRPAEAIAF